MAFFPCSGSLWTDFNINTDYEIEHRRPDIVVEQKSETECLIIDIAVPGDTRIKQKEQENIEKYQDQKEKLQGYGAFEK